MVTIAYLKSLVTAGMLLALPLASPAVRWACVESVTSLASLYERFTDELTDLPCRIATNITTLPEQLNPTLLESR